MNSEAKKIATADVTSKLSKPVILPPHASFELRFKGTDIYTLVETGFRFAPDASWSIQILTNNKGNGFQWSLAVRGLSLCFINYLLHSITRKPSDFKFVGPVYTDPKTKEKSSAASLGQGLGRKTIWVELMFGSDTATINVVIEKLFGGHNREGKKKNLDVTVTIQPSRLPPSEVKIFLNGAPLTKAADLEKLLQNIQRQCPQIVESADGAKPVGLRIGNPSKQLLISEPKAGKEEQKPISRADVERVVQEHINYNASWKQAAIKAAVRGNLTAQFNMGFCFEKGIGVKQDCAEAAKWFSKAAAKGDVRAQYSLGVCYQKGEGVAQKSTEAIKWFRKAAEQGDSRAQYSLGVCCYDVPKNYVECHKWLSLALGQEHGRAAKKLAAVETKMTKKQITEAQRLVGEFKRKHPKSFRSERQNFMSILSWQAALLEDQSKKMVPRCL